MHQKFILSIFIFFIFSEKNFSQQLPVPRNIQSAINKGTRAVNGKPGSNYWQNTADYGLKINFDPASRLLKGEEVINYTNNSPDTLKQVIFKLYPNLYKLVENLQR